MERIFQILAVILAGVAAFFLWKENTDWAFVTAVFGAVSFFLSVRFQVRDRMRQRALEEETMLLDEAGEAFIDDAPDELTANGEKRTTKNSI